MSTDSRIAFRTMKRVDIVIIGGGVMGCSTAFHLLRADPTLDLVVVERDPTYRQASSALSVGNARVQFSLRQNIEISRYTLQILERWADEMIVDGDRPDVFFRPEGNLFLVDSQREPAARRDLELQRRLGCSVEWWTPSEIEDRYPLYALADLVGGTFGSGDGHLDGYAFLMGFRRKAASLGATLLTEEVVGIRKASGSVTGVDLAGGKRLDCASVVNCAGAWATELVRSLGIELPVAPIRRQVFVVEPAIKPDSPLPLPKQPSGLYFRRAGPDRILVGKSLPDDPIGFDLDWQETRFVDYLWPELAGFVPAFDRLRFERGWAGLYAVNTFDGNAILGEWPELGGLYLACGFSGHGLQQAPAVGRFLAELILGERHQLDLSIFGADRLLEGRAISERALV